MPARLKDKPLLRLLVPSHFLTNRFNNDKNSMIWTVFTFLSYSSLNSWHIVFCSTEWIQEFCEKSKIFKCYIFVSPLLRQEPFEKTIFLITQKLPQFLVQVLWLMYAATVVLSDVILSYCLLSLPSLLGLKTIKSMSTWPSPCLHLQIFFYNKVS